MDLIEIQVTPAKASDAAGRRTPLQVALFGSRQAHLDNSHYARVYLKTGAP